MNKIKGLTYKLPAYGLYAVICHLCAIMLFFNINPQQATPQRLVALCGEMLTYSAVSLIAVILGAAAMSAVYAQAKEREE